MGPFMIDKGTANGLAESADAGAKASALSVVQERVENLLEHSLFMNEHDVHRTPYRRMESRDRHTDERYQ